MAIYQANTLQKYNDIVTTLNRLRNETQSIMRAAVAMLVAGQNRANVYIRQMARELYTRQRIDLMVTENIREYNGLRRIWESFLEVVTDLKKGYLNVFACPPSLMKKILVEASELLNSERPDFKLVFENADEYYEMKNMGFVYSKGLKNILIQVPLFLSLREMHSLQLYRLSSISVPFNDNGGSKVNGSSKVMLKK